MSRGVRRCAVPGPGPGTQRGPPKTTHDGLRAPKSRTWANLAPTWAQLGPTWGQLGPTWGQLGPPGTLKIVLSLQREHDFAKTRCWLPRAAQEAPRDVQQAPRAGQEGPGAAQDRPKSGPRAAKSGPRAAKSIPRSFQERPGEAFFVVSSLALETFHKNHDFEKDLYFVHSYACYPQNNKSWLATTKYGDHNFCSVVKENNIYGFQFHPEKSGNAGLKLLEEFLKL